MHHKSKMVIDQGGRGARAYVPACRPPCPWPSGRRTHPWCGTRSRLPPRTPFLSLSASSSLGSKASDADWGFSRSGPGWLAEIASTRAAAFIGAATGSEGPGSDRVRSVCYFIPRPVNRGVIALVGVLCDDSRRGAKSVRYIKKIVLHQPQIEPFESSSRCTAKLEVIYGYFWYSIWLSFPF
jgi:hypothetical protein